MSALTTLVSFIVFFLSLSAFAQNLPPDIPNEHSNNLSFNLPFGTTSFTFEIFPAVDPEGDNITYELLSSPSMGMISGCFSGTSSTTCTYTPYFSGVFESFSYRATDGNGYSQNINISIMDFGALPVTMKGPQTVKALMDTPSKFIVLGGQSNQYLYFETTTQPQHGTLSNCFGNNIYSRICTYTPDPGFTGLDSFTYRGSDYFSNSANQTVTFEILPVNNLPELSGNLSLTTTENSSLNIKIIKGIDADSDNIFYQVTSLPQNGSLSSCFNSLVDTEFSLFCNYKPDPGYIGVDSFTVVANDGKQNSNTSFTINLNVQSQNNAPTVGANQSVSLDEDSSINFTVNVGTDPDNDDLQYSIYSYPSNGSLSNCLKNNLDNSYSRDCTYTPNEDFNGVDSMSYRVTDLQNTSSTTATVTFTTNSINDAPIMLGDSSTFIQVNQPTYVTLPAATDADGDSLVYYLITQPSHGIIQDCLQGTDDLTCAYFPDQDFTGVDTITYKANDGVSDSVNISYYALRVGVTNDEPDMVGDQSFNGYENTELFFTLNGATDSDNDPLNYHIISSPDSGTLSDCLNNTGDLTCRYIPDPSFIGTVTFTYKANDGVENSTVYSTVTLNILNTNDAPIIGIDQNFSVNEDELLSFNISPATDLDGDYLTYEIVSPPSSGLVYGCANGTGSTTCFYQPDENFSGSVSFTYKASDGSLDSANFATVSIEVLEVNDLPVMISDQSFSGNEDTTFSFILNGATDSDSGTLIYSVVSPPSNGSLSNCLNETSSLNCDFTPGPNFNGQITFSYKANDGVSDSVNTSTVTLTINPVNDAPIMAANQSFIVNEDTPVNFTINAATDIEGDTLTYSIVDISDDPNAGVVSDCLESNGDLTCTYTPAGNISGEFSFDYIANDGQLNALTKAMVTITVLPVNDVPEMIADQSIETNENTPVDFILNGAIDIDATDNLTYSVVTAPTNGVLSNCIQSDSDLSCTYTPSNNFSGVDTFTYQANDSVTNSSSVSTVTINVFALNSAPTFASTQSFETYEDTSLSFEVAPAQDLDEDLLTYTLVSSPAYGTLENCLEGNTDLICDYIPNGNYNGVDSFTYIASDGELTSEIQAQVLINVLAVNDRPVMNNLAENFQVLEDSTANIITLAGAVDIDGDSLTYSTVINPSHGTLSNCLQGTSGLNCEYTPNTNFSGAETFTYVASDGQEFALVESTVNISVIGSDDPPLIGANQSFTFNEDEVFQFNLNPGFDPEGSPVSYILTQPPSSGTLVGCLDGSLLTSCTYIPQENFNGAITFYYKVNDGSLDSTSFAQIDFNILPVNDAPELIASQSFSLPYSGGSFIVANATDVEGNILTYEITQNAQYGSVSNCLNNNGDLDCDYIPNAGFTGVDLFSYRAFDGDKYSSSSTVSITINPSNSAPVMIGDQTFEGEQDINLDFTAQGATDAEGNILSYSVVTAPQHGVLTNCLNSTSVLNCTYIPNPGFYGVDTFTYKANDGLLDSLTTSTITIDLIEANANPVLGANQSFSTSKNISFGFAVNMASDSDGDTLVYSIVSGPSNGTLSNCLQNDSDLSCTYTPNLDFVGSDSFTYKANDGIEDSIEVATVFITVNEINNPPVMIGNQSFETQEDVPANFAANGATDADGDVITYSTVTGPSHGTLTNCFNNTSNLECLYTPNSGYTGNDSFTYVAYDGKNNSISTSTITIQVSEVPDASIIQSIYIGAYQNCIENGGGIFRCWGQGGQGQLGIDSSINKNPQFSMEPVLITNNIEKLYMGERNACAILKNGDVKCWGKNWYGELGIDNTTSISTSVSTSILNSPTTNVGFPVKKLALGANFTCALSDDGLGRVRCWGLNSSGQLGYASSVVSTSQRVGDGNGITIQDAGDLEIGEPIADIFASSSFHCMLSVAGNVYCTNLPSYGNPSIRVGVFQTPQQAGPIPIGGTVINMGLGSSHACALLSSGSVRCWGNGSRGQLGINTTGYYGDDEQPLTVPTINFGTTASIVKLQGGNDATCALFSNKKMKCWGDGTTRGLNGQGIGQNVGDGVGPSVASVPFIDIGNDVEDFGLYPNGGWVGVLKSDNNMKFWGYNFNGLIGISGLPLTSGDNEVPSSLPDAIFLPAGSSSPVLASFTVSPLDTQVNVPISFDASSSSSSEASISSYSWTFGDGATGSGAIASHTYSSIGSYTVSLTVTDANSNQTTIERTLNITQENIEPVAQFIASNELINGVGTISFDANSSFDGDGVIESYAWQFGDGQVGSGKTTSHSYLLPGVYTVQLLVTDNRGAQNISTKLITVNDIPEAGFSASVASGYAPLNVSFDGSFSTDSDDGITSYNWQFGDGSISNGQTISHIYQFPGTYTAILTVEDSRGAQSSVSMTIEVEGIPQNPIADFTLSSTSINQGEFVSFDASSSSDPDGSLRVVKWSFGDGALANGYQTSHIYAQAGTFTATLEVEDFQGLTATKTETITVNAKPIADFNFTPLSGGDYPLFVSFDASASSDAEAPIANYSWTFGDGATATGVNPTHTYSTDGTFTITLTVTDSSGVDASIQKTITVTKPNIAPVADFDFNISEGDYSVTVDFNGSLSSDSDGAIVSYEWLFPDSSTASGVSVSKEFFTTLGSAVQLTVTDNRGATATISKVVNFSVPQVTIVLEQPNFAYFVNEVQTLESKVLRRDGQEIVNKNLTWSSSNETVATVNSSGSFTALSAGTTVITATHISGVSHTSTIEVREPTTNLVTNLQANSFLSESISELKGKLPSVLQGQRVFTQFSPNPFDSSYSTRIFKLNLPLGPGLNNVELSTLNSSYPVVNQSVRFVDGIGDLLRFQVGQSATLTSIETLFNDSFTMSFWLRGEGTGSLIEFPHANGSHKLSMGSNQALKLALDTDNGKYAVATTSAKKTDSRKVTLVYDKFSSILSIYVNAKKVSETSISGILEPLTSSVIIGGQANIHLDELRLWSRALNNSEIQTDLFADNASAPSNGLAFFDFENIKGQSISSNLGGDEKILLGSSTAIEENDPSVRKQTQLLVSGNVDSDSVSVVKAEGFSFKTSETSFNEDFTLDVIRESSNSYYRLPTEFEMLGDIYRLRPNKRLNVRDGIKMSIKVSEAIELEDIIVMTSSLDKEIRILNPGTIKLVDSTLSFPVFEFGDYFVVMKNSVASTVELTAPLISEYGRDIQFRRFNVEGAFGSTLNVDGELEGYFISGLYCNGQWLSNVPTSFPISLPLNSGANFCQISVRYNYNSVVGYYLWTPLLLSISNQ